MLNPAIKTEFYRSFYLTVPLTNVINNKLEFQNSKETSFLLYLSLLTALSAINIVTQY